MRSRWLLALVPAFIVPGAAGGCSGSGSSGAPVDDGGGGGASSGATAGSSGSGPSRGTGSGSGSPGVSSSSGAISGSSSGFGAGSSSSGASNGSSGSSATDGGGDDAATSDAASDDAGGPPGQMLVVELTLYGWPDNSPPGNSIAYPTIHQGAGGTGTYADPITFATDKSEEPPGTIIYIPSVQEYAIMEDDCVQCDSDWSQGMNYHFDLWLNSDGSCNNNDVLNCEDQWSNSKATVEIGPPPGRPVNPAPLYDIATNTCRAN